MQDIIKFESFERKLITIKDTPVLLDKDVAMLYGVETKALNQNVKKNIDLFPEEFRFQLTKEEWNNLRSSEITSSLKHGGTRHLPYVFTEEGLYMVATILRSEIAKQVHFHIVKTFAKLRELNRNINTIIKTTDEDKQKRLIQKSNEILEDVMDFVFEEDENSDNIIESETKVELNLGFYKKTKTTKRKKDN